MSIRQATPGDIEILSSLLRDMMQELFEDAEGDIKVYHNMVLSYFNDSSVIIYIDDSYNGFFVVRDETEPCLPSRKILNGIKVYIKPAYRKSRLLYRFYQRLFRDFPDHEIWGLTEAHSEHIDVLDKRHECVAKVYKLRRPEWALEAR